MSLDEKMRNNDNDEMIELLLTGADISPMLEKAEPLNEWEVTLSRNAERPHLLLFSRLNMPDFGEAASVLHGRLLWLDRKERFAVTTLAGLVVLRDRKKDSKNG